MASQDGKRCRISASCTVKGSDYAGQFYIIVISFVLTREHYNIDLKDLLVHLDFYVLFCIWQTGLEKNLFGKHPVSRSTESRSPPPAFASDALINVSSSSHTQQGRNLLAENGEYSKSAVSEIVEIDVPSSAGNYMKTSSPGVRHSSYKLVAVSCFCHNCSNHQSMLYIACCCCTERCTRCGQTELWDSLLCRRWRRE